jgi:hypothetical protein
LGEEDMTFYLTDFGEEIEDHHDENENLQEQQQAVVLVDVAPELETGTRQPRA